MRPGVPWNVKGIEAEARDMAQLAARRAGVSLGEWLTQVIMMEGRGAPQPYYVPGDGTYGPAPQPQYQPPLPSVRYPQAFPQQHAQAYAQQQPQAYAQQQPQPYQQTYPHAVPQQHPHLVHPQPSSHQPQPFARDPLGGAAQTLDSQIRGSEFAVVAHGLRDLADRLEGSERRAQQAIATVNQSVAAMQDRIDAAERVKQLADVAFSSAADALATSARDQSVAFESLESTVRGVQRRLNEIEAGRTELPGKDAMGRLETALGQLQKRLSEMETVRGEAPYKDVLQRMESTVGQLQKRLGEIETARHEFPHKDAMARLEAQIGDVRHDIADSEKRSREDLTQLAKFMRELGTRVDTAERNAAQGGGKSLVEGVSARLDALEARSQTSFEDLRGSLSSMDSRIAQTAASSKGGIPADAFNALKRSVDQLNSRFESVNERMDGIVERFEGVGDPSGGPLSGPIGAIESTLETLTSKIEDGERRAADSVATVSNALKTISTRLDESDKRQAQAVQTMTRRFDDVERKTTESAHTVEDSLKALTQRLETSDKKHKEAIGGLRLTVDGLVAKAAAEALPLDSPLARATATPSHLSGTTHFTSPPAPDFVPPPRASDRIDPEFPPFTTTTSKHLADAPPPPPSFEPETPPPLEKDGYSVSALQTIMAGTLGAPAPTAADLPPHFDSERYSPEPSDLDSDGFETQPRKDDFLSQARRAAQAAAQAEAERPQQRKSYLSSGKGESGGRNVGRLMIISLACIALVAGIVALLFTMPGGSNDDTNRPAAGESLGEILNGPASTSAEPGPAAAFVPPTPESTSPVEAASVAVEPNGLGVPTSEPAPSFTAGTSPLPGGSIAASETAIAALEVSATRGDARAQLVLALRYAEGRGVEKDDGKAASLVTKAAQQGLVIAEYRLGAIYERGVGVPKDLAQARTWYEKAAKGGNRKAMHNLAVLYAEGDVIGKNFQEAARWFRQGAEHGLADSQYNYAILLEQGMGVDKNLTEAAKWYAVAHAQGDVGAAERLEVLKKTLSAGDIAMAFEAARNFKPKPLDQTANEVPVIAG